MNVRSTGDSPNTIVVDTLSAHVELLSFSSSKGECSYDPATRILRCELGLVKTGDDIEIRLHVRHRSDPGGVLENAATASGDKPDLLPENNKGFASGRPSVDLEKAASADSVAIGEDVTYTINVKTGGSMILIADTLGLELDFVSVSSSSPELPCRYDESARAVVCETDRPGGITSTIVIEVIAREAGVIPNVVTVRREDFSNDLEIQKDTVVVVVRGGTTTSGEPGVGLPARFVVRGNHPNPFASETTIRVDLPSGALLRVDVFDVLGRHVLAIPEKAVFAGASRSVELDASGLTSGVYLYRLTAVAPTDTDVAAGRFVVVR